eukprot:TRINITY_DN18753_c0_g1_i1.p1 TRINITY_DN18753_c0_g1~~TRINITY_DN18753_c0_g1_i1.p1  ORF type:complete len:287 (-),score=68.78 TRINITY_DN18753_c0_g1_i1:55-915(-)
MTELTPFEASVIRAKNTERPFNNKFFTHFEEGVYACRQCNTPLYASEAKFPCDCGWPAFDSALGGAVATAPDADGARTEIICAKCHGHLGHVFSEEGVSKTGIRHCVNSVSLEFHPRRREGLRTALFAAGCFWGVEYWFQRAPGVVSTRCGYTGGRVEAPTYQQVCNGDTGHAETVEVAYDPAKVSYEQLCKLFFEIHDPTQVNGQGPDEGEQYRSVIFYQDEEQHATAAAVLQRLQRVLGSVPVATQLAPATGFYPAEDYHQDYYHRTGKQPYCHRPVRRRWDSV